MTHRWTPVAALAFVCVLQLCSAQVCTVTEEAGQFIYRAPPVTASNCEYSWSNATGSRDTVLAHHKGGRDEVSSNNISTLITSQCFDHIIYKCKCFPEVLYYQVNCTTTCDVNPAPLEMNGTGRLYIGTIAVIALLLLLLVAACAFFLVYRRRISNYGSVKTDPESSSFGEEG